MQHDQMKDQFIAQGGVQKLVDFVRDCDVDRQSKQQLTDVVSILWSCTLNKPQVAEVIKQDLGCMTRIHQLLKEGAGDKALQQAVEGLLWKVEREEQFNQQKKAQKGGTAKEGDNKGEEEEEEEEDLYDLMISYSWADKELVLRIFRHMRDQLGFKIWLDEEQMHGSTIEAMVSLSSDVRNEMHEVCIGECSGPF
jgi:hypothetical protein